MRATINTNDKMCGLIPILDTMKGASCRSNPCIIFPCKPYDNGTSTEITTFMLCPNVRAFFLAS